MSRSRRRTPIAGITSATSEKADKQAAHRRERRKLRSVLRPASDVPEVLPVPRDVSNPWAMAKDGKLYYGAHLSAKQLRK